MRQSYFISVVFLWFIGYLFKEIHADCEPRLYVNASAAPGGDGSSWATAYNKLQDAISQANSCAGISEIWVAQGTYFPDEGTGITDNDRSQSFDLKSGLAIYGGFVGNETDLDQRNWELTILSGEIGAPNTTADNSIHVVRGISVDNTAILDGFTITAGNANAGPPDDDGGGIYNHNSSPQILNCSLSGNHASDNGGGMANITASPSVVNCSFSANTAAGFGGGGAFANLFDSSPTFTGCSFSGNSAPFGGAGLNVNASQTFINCSFSGNAASTNGAGMYNASCTPTFINCIFSTNLAAKKGAGMYNTNADPIIINCSFRGNSPIENGGGMYNINSSDPVLTNCILWGNINGEIVNDGSSTATVTYSIVKGGHPGTSNLDIDPLFVNAGAGNLRLQACSPAIDAGSNVVVTNTTDVEGNERLVNATNDVSAYVDMGAYEFAGTASTTKYYPDADGDQHGDPNNPLRSCNVLSGYVTNNNDCNDGDASVYPGAPEICDDGIDNNCDGVIDPEKAWYQDLDNDKWGNFGVPAIYSCTQPAGYVDRGGDCNDIPSDDIFNDGRAVNPGMNEICGDLQDNDCNGLVDDIYVYYHDADGDGLGNPADRIGSCSEDPPQHYVLNHDDCNDTGNPFTGILYVNVNATGPIYNGLSWSSAYKNLQDALTYACSATTQIWVAQGTYYPDQGFGKVNNARYETFILKNNVAIYGGFAGGETQLSQRNWKVNITTLSGDVDGDNTLSSNSWHVVFNDGNNLTNSARLDGFHITGGNASGYNFIGDEKPYQAGAGMYNKNSFPTVANCVFESNSSWAKGGAVYNWNTGPTNTSKYENCSFISNNVAGGTDASGGAIYNEQVGANMINCEFFANIAQFRGGAIYNYGTSGIITVTNCVFYGNVSTTSGKDISNFSEGSGNITSCIFWGDNSPIFEFLADHLTVSHSIVQQASGVYPGTGNLNVDPLFIDQGAGNLRLQAGSPAIDAGDDAANNTSYDLDVLPRKVSTIDMGAYEFGSSTPGCTDETAPTFTGSYADENLGCNPANPDGSLGTATATDASGAVTITSIDALVVSDGCNRSRTRTFTAIDGCNNTATISRTVRWIADLTSPSFTGSYADENLGCNPANPNGSLGTATATDVCGGVTITSSDGAVLSDGCNRSRTRTFTATDGCLNTSTTSRTVRWIADLTPAAFTGSYADVNLGCNPANPDGSLGTATATDGCGDVTITSSDGAVVSEGCNRSRTRTFIATDGCLNTSTTSRTVRWTSDNTPPAFTGNNYADVNLGCNPANPDGSLGTATATDGCGAVTITSSDGAVLSEGCNRSRTRTFTATDGCLNTSTTSRTVRWIADLTPAAFTGSYADVNLGCNPANPDGSLGTATATDGCGDVTITSSDGAVVSNGCNRSRTRTFIATDGCLNTSTTSRTVRWTSDNTPPAFTGNNYADVNLGCNPGNPDGSLGTATATDGCGAVTITSSDGVVVSNGCNRARTRTFTATDGCLNTSTTSRTVRWTSDNTPPAFTGNNYADVNLGCNPGNPDGSLGTATATDGCGAVTITSSDGVVVSNGCNRSRTRTFTATDGCLNTSTISRTVRWIADLTPPAFTGYYSDVNLGCNPGNPDGSLGTATATDGCGAVTITSSDGAVVSNGCNRSRTRIFTATDGCLNTSTTSRTVRWIYDVTAPTLICAKTGTVTKSTNQGLCTYTINGIEFNPTASDVCSTPSLAWSVSDATNTSGNTTMAGVVLNFGNNTIKWTATDDCGNTSTCSFIVNVNKVTTTTSLVVSTTPASNPVTQQYSDKITCVATVTNCPNAGPIGGTVTFKIINAQGTVVLGTAPVASDGTATLTDTLIENQFYPGATNLLPGNGPLKPGNKTVTAEYSGTDPDYIVTNPTAPLVVNCEDAEITYNGLNYFGANPNTNQGTITVSAFVLDTNDVNDIPAQARGDIRNATVTFKEGTSGGVAIGTTNIPVGLVNPTNFQEGIVTTNKTYTLTTQDINCGGKIVDVWAGVNNYYCGEIAEVVPVCLSLPGGDFVTGGGWIKMLNSEGSYAGTDDQKMHAALAFKWNKSNKNLQGNATIVYKRIVNGVQKVYQVKSNSITSMIVNNVNDLGTAVATGATYRMAQIITKANFRDITDPELPVALFGNLTLTITAWESIATTDGSKDRITVELVGSGSQGLIFSSNWLSGATQWQQLNSGKMRVRNPSAEIPCTNCSGSGITTRTGEVDKATETIPATEDLKVTVMPNPSSTNFRITVNSNDLKEPVKLLITDMLGRVIETRITNAGQTITICNKYISGTYAVRILQGRKTRQLTLIKLSD